MAASAVGQGMTLQCSSALRISDSSTKSCERTVACQLHLCGSQPVVQRRQPQRNGSALVRSTFVTGARLVSSTATTRTSLAPVRRGVQCMAEPDAQSNDVPSADIWLGRAAMLAFTAILTMEIVSGKGIFNLAGLDTPSPGLAIAVAIVLGGGATFSILRTLFK